MVLLTLKAMGPMNKKRFVTNIVGDVAEKHTKRDLHKHIKKNYPKHQVVDRVFDKSTNIEMVMLVNPDNKRLSTAMGQKIYSMR